MIRFARYKVPRGCFGEVSGPGEEEEGQTEGRKQFILDGQF